MCVEIALKIDGESQGVVFVCRSDFVSAVCDWVEVWEGVMWGTRALALRPGRERCVRIV